MHKIKDVVTKFFHPSFLFSPSNDTDRPKRKRSDFTEEVNEEQQIDRTPRNDQRDNRRSNNTDDEPQLTDDEDSYSRDVPSTEQQTKRRRTANYQHILSTNSHQESDRASPPSNSIDSVVSSTYTTPILRRTSIEQNYSEVINSSRPLYHHPSTYRKVTSNYDPSKSPLFSFGNRTTTTTTTATAQSNQTAANHLLATSLIDRSSSSSSSSSLSTNKQSSGTLTNPISNRRQMFGANYSSINSRRLPYIERLRRRTLQDCIRLDRTLDHEPLSTTTEEPEPTTITSVSKPIKAPEKECGIQCDIAIVEPSQKSQATFPPKEIRNEVVSMPIAENFQTNSSITIEKRQPQTTNTITKPKVLGNITPFSWPKFARAQEEYAKTYPDKCRNDAVVPFLVGKYNVNISSANQSQTNIANAPKLPLSSSRPTESIWQCPCCTKEHSAQTALCSLCYKFNPDYKKPSASQPSVLIAKESVPSITTANTTTVAVTKESNTFTPVTSNFNKTITKESVVTTSSSTITTNSLTAPFPSLPIIPSTSVSITTNENPVTTTANSSVPVFGIKPTTSQQSTITTTSTPTPSSTIPVFNTISTITPTFMFGTKPFGSSTTATTTNSSTTITQPSIGIVTTKENPLITTRQFSFGTLSSSDNSMSTSPTTSLPVTAAFQPFASLASTSLTPAVTTSSSVPSIPFVPFGTSPLITTTTTTATTTAIATTTANTSTTPISFGFPGVSLASPAFGTSNFTSTITLPSNNPPFGLNTTNSLRSFSPTSITAVNANNAPTFGSLVPFGTSSMFNERPANPFPPSTSANPTPLFNFGVTPTNTQTSTASIVGGFAFGAQSSAPPLFGATSQSTFPPNLMNFGIQASTSNISDPFKNSSLTADLSSTPDSGPTLFNIGSEGPRSDSPRRILRGRRQGKP